MDVWTLRRYFVQSQIIHSTTHECIADSVSRQRESHD